ncbi:MAG TPA: hypothetical protein VNU95_14610 [Candidatus Acidoferrales bacterium]|nr:hypothetical protein [Candidatus Acidoferrales bacterium]
MPKALDLRITGLSFEEAGKRLANAKPTEAQKPTKKASSKRRKKG